VLETAAASWSSREITIKPAITETTVKTHLRSIFTKLDVLSRT